MKWSQRIAGRAAWAQKLQVGRLGMAVFFVTGLAVASVSTAQAAVLKYQMPLARISANQTTLYNSVNGKTFTPRGTNFVRLAQAADGSLYHSTFEPGQYNGNAVQGNLDYMKSSGYNVVRVFIDSGEFTNPSHGISTGVSSLTPINAAYMNNVADFVQRAGADDIYTVPVLDGVPANTYYYNVAKSPSGNIQGNNVLYLDPNYVAAKKMYMTQFTTALIAQIGTPRSSDILAYESDNEVFFETNKAPFNMMSGTLTSLDGLTYDMSQPAQREQAADANLVVYSAYMKQALQQADPNALLMMGFFTNNAVGNTGGYNGFQRYCSTNCTPGVDYRTPGRPAAVSIYGKADVIDLHAYPNSPSYSLQSDMASSEITLFQKPYILGEFGAMKSVYGNSITAAANAMRNLQVTSCSLNAQGWMFWTWDTDTTTSLASQNLFYSIVDSGGAINGQLAPVARPNACQ